MLKIASFFAILAAASAGVAPALPLGQPGFYGGPAYAAAQPVLRAAPVAYAQPAPLAYAAQPAVVAKAVAVAPAEPFDPNPQYNYGYSIQDGLTGDQKQHQETRNGDAVQGQYSLVEPDGAVRTVTYTSDPVNGFNAVVDRTAPQVAVHAAPAIAKVHAAPVYAQPALVKSHAAGPVFA